MAPKKGNTAGERGTSAGIRATRRDKRATRRSAVLKTSRMSTDMISSIIPALTKSEDVNQIENGQF